MTGSGLDNVSVSLLFSKWCEIKKAFVNVDFNKLSVISTKSAKMPLWF